MSDDWDFFPLLVDDEPASILVDLGLVEEAPIAGLTQMTYLRLYMRSPREDGLSSQEEYERLCEVEDALSAAIEDSEDVLYVGRNTSGGCRDFYYYAASGTAAESQLSQAMVPFTEYEFETGVQDDDDWSIYFEFLYPDPRQMQFIQNGRVLASLEEAGDKSEIEREVTHWIYFPSADKRAAFVTLATAEGFEVAEQQDDGEGECPFALMMRHVTAVDYSSINNAVLVLFDLAGECEGEYAGWETSVEQGE
ncbi:DUF695 domain-containing protein [Blastopirellula sp. JC732]|uniref:DUF695 domain-containing protein n=1 Tax=Blastopirellula sediminis TaxID=2894196 RepID=A0A9X1SHT7_9BACT|nr:DUF695 domain-containing protein [Blastopirellula sediminis]MCC9606541.1 DUF695 domain-containing protein [Blastopirellula sediminis]MCC9630161.1 DUF695 domain-containing protein [Blastopirellula sediminis]